MPGMDIAEGMLEHLNIPPPPPGISREEMARALEILVEGFYKPIDAPFGKPISAKSTKLPRRKFCTRQACSRCDHQFLSPSQIARLGPHHQFLDRTAFKERVDKLSNDILTDFAFIHKFGGKAEQRGLSLPGDEFCRLLDEAFPYMLRSEYFINLEQADKSFEDVRECHEHGLRFFAWHRDSSFDPDNPGKDFLANVLQMRAKIHPCYHLANDNSDLEVGWSLLAFKLLSAECFVDFSMRTSSYCRVVDVVPGELHKDLVYTATRAALLLDTQAIIYKRLRQLASWILAPDIPPQPSISWPFPTLSTDMMSIMLNVRLSEEVLPSLDDLIGVLKNGLSICRTQKVDDTEDVRIFSEWLEQTGCPPQKALLLACYRHTLLRMHEVALLQLVRQDLGDLQSAVQGFLKGSASLAKVLAAWEGAEDSLSIFCRLLCRDALELSPYFNHYKHIMYSHYDDWPSIWACKDNHVSFADQVASGSAMVRLLCPGWTMPQKLRLVLSLLLNDSDACFEDEHRLGMDCCFRFALRAYMALQGFNPCGDAPTQSSSLMRKLYRCFDWKFDPRAASVLAKLLPQMKKSQPKRWTDMLWQKAFETIEDTWARQNMESKWRRCFREVLSMPERQDDTPKPGNSISDEESSASGFEPNRRADLGQVVEPFTVPDRGTRTKRHACKGGGMLSGLWASDETLRDFGVSEGIKYGTPEKECPSQFDEQVPAAKAAKRRRAPGDERQSDPVTLEKKVGADMDGPKRLVFRDPVLYDIWCQIFPMPGSNARQRIKWDDLRRVMHEEPLYFEEIRSTGVEFRWRREARDGYPAIELGFHQPHGMNSWIEKNLLKNIRKRIHRFTGWVAETFVLIDQE